VTEYVTPRNLRVAVKPVKSDGMTGAMRKPSYYGRSPRIACVMA
jgi:hypothetical protein